MSFCSSLSSPRSFSLLSKTRPSNGDYRPASTVSFTSRFQASAEVLDFRSADRLESRKKQPFDRRVNCSAEEAVQHQVDALKYNDQPRQDYGIEFERFRRILHNSTCGVLLGHKERDLEQFICGGGITTTHNPNQFKQRAWIQGSCTEEEEIFQFTMVQRVGGSWDGYWLTEGLLHDGDACAGGLAH